MVPPAILLRFNLDSRIISLGKVAKHLFPLLHTLPEIEHTSVGDVIYIVSFLVGLILWGFSIVWFIVAVMMIATAGPFPFNMGWWGFIFPVGQYFHSQSSAILPETY
jgi:tellurite resistance protein TehA-like permease